MMLLLNGSDEPMSANSTAFHETEPREWWGYRASVSPPEPSDTRPRRGRGAREQGSKGGGTEYGAPKKSKQSVRPVGQSRRVRSTASQQLT